MTRANNFPPAVVAIMSYSGLAIARALGRRGVKVYGLTDSRDEVGVSSRYLTPVISPHIIDSEEETLKALLDLSDRIGRPAVLFCTGDAIVLPVSRNREKLEGRFKFLMPDKDLVQELLSKDGLARVLDKLGLPAPKSTPVADPTQLNQVIPNMKFPVLIKPMYSASWYKQETVNLIGARKAIIVNDDKELEHWYSLIRQVDPRIILQEFIPGEDSRLYYVCGYINSQGVLEAAFAGQKVRIIPTHLGSASFVKSVKDTKLIKAAVDLLCPLGYKGFFGVELKKDPRDSEYKVIEVNVRFGLWDGLAGRCGIDLAYLGYAREAGLPYEVRPDYKAGIRWVSMRRDIDAFIDYRKEGAITLPQWIGSLMGPTQHAVMAFDDPVPGAKEFWKIFSEKSKSVIRRVPGFRPGH